MSLADVTNNEETDHQNKIE